MLRIRDEQRTAFREAAFKNFEDRMIEHLREFSPRHFNVLAEPDFRKIIRLGWERAQNHGLTSERDVCLYVQLMLMLGSDFDSDPQIPWAAEILHAQVGVDASEHVNRLNEKAWDYAEHVVRDYQNSEGAIEPQRLVEQVRRIRQESNDTLTAAMLHDFYQRMIAELTWTFPHKCEYVGELGLRCLINKGIESAQSYGLNTRKATMLCIVMMFVVGSGFHSDPQLPWVAEALRDPATAGDPQARTEALLARAVDCLTRWWA